MPPHLALKKRAPELPVGQQQQLAVSPKRDQAASPMIAAIVAYLEQHAR
jgi:hypothetical protein